MSPTVSLCDLDVLELEPAGPAAGKTGQWPCPFCGQQRWLTDAYTARVRNRGGMPLERMVLLCETCASVVQHER